MLAGHTTAYVRTYKFSQEIHFVSCKSHVCTNKNVKISPCVLVTQLDEAVVMQLDDLHLGTMCNAQRQQRRRLLRGT